MSQGSLAFDEFGRPFLILRDQEKQKRLTGIAAQKVRKNNSQLRSKYLKIYQFIVHFYNSIRVEQQTRHIRSII